MTGFRLIAENVLKGKEMTQEEYNALTDEEQNALVATRILGWGKDGHGQWVNEAGQFAMYYDWKVKPTYEDLFDPKHNLDHAFMGVDKLKKKMFTLEWMGGEKWWACLILDENVDTEWYSANGDTRNEAIILACLKAKGVVE